MTKILLIGPQGAGKSTQAKLLSQYLGIPFISTGDIFREISSEDSPEGIRIREILGQGRLVDDKTVSEMVQKKLGQDSFKNGFIIDGYPRTLEQINYFDPTFDKVLYLNLSDEEATKRLLNRGREDDTEDLIANRLKQYHDLTDSIIDYYEKKGILKEINGSKSIIDVAKDLKRAVNE